VLYNQLGLSTLRQRLEEKIRILRAIKKKLSRKKGSALNNVIRNAEVVTSNYDITLGFLDVLTENKPLILLNDLTELQDHQEELIAQGLYRYQQLSDQAIRNCSPWSFHQG